MPERDLATFTHHSQNSRTLQQYYIFASSTRANDIARQLTSNSGQDNERLNQVFQQEGEIRRKVGNQLLSSSPFEIGQQFVIPVSPCPNSCPPIIRITIRGEIEIWREFPRELKDRSSGMMLKVDWSACDDNDEIRTLLCQSLIQRIIDKKRLQRSCIDEYEEEIDE
ncbi:MAG: hypothetical protein EZS28_044916 [Streblomastix strix]|uniref:Uncharacterized protein n=1 Tax=Streblomastix strix TaxID=222440 RepID=A0A5J4TMM0_9EUKA|nr:MAG: hypothetical protein EZS28_044916 [Streblomastix strix]